MTSSMKKSEIIAVIVGHMGLEPWIKLRSEALEWATIESEDSLGYSSKINKRKESLKKNKRKESLKKKKRKESLS